MLTFLLALAFTHFIAHKLRSRRACFLFKCALEVYSIFLSFPPTIFELITRNINAGENWAESIMNAIAYCEIFVLLISESSNNSAQVQRELERAVNKGKRIYCIKVGEFKISKHFEYFISINQWKNISNNPAPGLLNSIAEEIMQLLGNVDPDRLKTKNEISQEEVGLKPSGGKTSENQIKLRKIAFILMATVFIAASFLIIFKSNLFTPKRDSSGIKRDQDLPQKYPSDSTDTIAKKNENNFSNSSNNTVIQGNQNIVNQNK